MNVDNELRHWAASMNEYAPPAESYDRVMQDILNPSSVDPPEPSLEEQLHWLMRAADTQAFQVTVWIFAILLNLVRTASTVTTVIIN